MGLNRTQDVFGCKGNVLDAGVAKLSRPRCDNRRRADTAEGNGRAESKVGVDVEKKKTSAKLLLGLW